LPEKQEENESVLALGRNDCFSKAQLMTVRGINRKIRVDNFWNHPVVEI
jgi:hypothetical protein